MHVRIFYLLSTVIAPEDRISSHASLLLSHRKICPSQLRRLPGRVGLLRRDAPTIRRPKSRSSHGGISPSPRSGSALENYLSRHPPGHKRLCQRRRRHFRSHLALDGGTEKNCGSSGYCWKHGTARSCQKRCLGCFEHHVKNVRL